MATTRPPRCPLNAERATSGAQLVTLPAPIQPTPTARSSRRPSGGDGCSSRSGAVNRSVTTGAGRVSLSISSMCTAGDGGEGGGLGAGGGVATDTGGAGGGLGAGGAATQTSDSVALSRSTALTASTVARRSGAAVERGSVCTTVRPERLSLTQISATPEPKKIPNAARASAFRSARSTVARRSTLLATTSVSTSNRAAPSSPRTRASASVATAPGASGTTSTTRRADWARTVAASASAANSAPAPATRRPRPRSAARASFIASV